MRIRRAVAAMGIAVVVSVSGGVATADAQKRWVGLGDSFAAGPLIPDQVSPAGCLKSNRNFARQAASRLGYAIADVSCSGARTDHMTVSQSIEFGSNPPQFNALTATTNVVTISIGGNDIGFSEILEECATEDPFDDRCRDKYLVDGRDIISERITAAAPKVRAVFSGIRSRSPSARVYAVNYIPIFPESGYGCWPQVPIAFLDVPYLRSKQRQLNAMIASQATATGVTLVDAYGAAIGRDACKSSGTRWIEPLAPATWAAPFHPNLRGMTGIADRVVATVGS